MSFGFADIPNSDAYALTGARIPAPCLESMEGMEVRSGLADADLVISSGKIMAVRPSGSMPESALAFDMRKGLALPGLVDIRGAAAGATAPLDRRAARFVEFVLRTAHAHGTVAIRAPMAHAPGAGKAAWAGLLDLRARFSERIAVQFVPLSPGEALSDDGFSAEIAALAAKAGGVLGCALTTFPRAGAALDRAFRVGIEHGLDLDIHVQETSDAAAGALALIAEKAVETRFPGIILTHPGTGFADAPAEVRRRALARLKEAGVAVAVPLLRGERAATLLLEAKAEGARLCLASDDLGDPFAGHFDPLEPWRIANRAGRDTEGWAAAAACHPAAIMRGNRGKIVVGAPADLVLLPARSWSEFSARSWSNRTVLRAGRPISTALPDFTELDDIVHSP